MAVEYRPACADEMREFVYSDRVGFGESTADTEVERSLAIDFLHPDETLCAFEDGEMVAKMGTLPFTMRWNGRDIGCGGVTAVTTLPTHRRRGHLRQMMWRAFATMRERGQPVAMLWASMAAIYQRFGYGVGYTGLLHREFDPRLVRFVDDIPTPGRTRMVKVTEAAAVIAPAYERFAAPRTLMLGRDAGRWDILLRQPWRPPDHAPALVVTYEEAGHVLGYAVYEIEQRSTPAPGPNEKIDVWELAWLTPSAYRALTRHLIGHDLVGWISIHRAPTDDPLFHHVQEPRLLNTTVRDGTLVRIVDLVAALEGRGYDADGRLRFAFEDDLCPWNTGTWELTVEGGRGRLKPSGSGHDLALTPRSLAMLACGHQGATALARYGLIPSGDADVLRAADDLFRTACAPLCSDGF
jgi:predicted acetyltransferase